MPSEACSLTRLLFDQWAARAAHIVHIVGAQQEIPDAQLVHARADGGIEIGIIAVDLDAAGERGAARAIGAAVAVIDVAVVHGEGLAVVQLHRGADIIGQLVAGMLEEGEGVQRNGEVIEIRLGGLAAAAIGEGARDIAEIERRRCAVGPDKLGAAQRIARVRAEGDQAALGGLRLADIVGMDQLGLAVGAAVIGRIVHQPGILEPGTLIDEEGVGAGKVGGAEDDMAAVAGEIGAVGQFGLDLAMVVLPGIAAFQIGGQSVEVLVQDDVDHAGHRVRTPGRRGAAGHDIDALDQAGRHGGQIDAAGDAGGDHALAVEQDQGAQHAQLAQIDHVDARRARDDDSWPSWNCWGPRRCRRPATGGSRRRYRSGRRAPAARRPPPSPVSAAGSRRY